MKIRRWLGLIVSILVLVNATMLPVMASTKASYYLDSYAIGVSAKEDGKMIVTYGVYGTKTMDKIGADSLKIEMEVSTNNWVSIATIYGEDHLDEFYSYDALYHEGMYTFWGVPGNRYRVTMIAAASLNGGGDTGEIVSTPRLCKA